MVCMLRLRELHDADTARYRQRSNSRRHTACKHKTTTAEGGHQRSVGMTGRAKTSLDVLRTSNDVSVPIELCKGAIWIQIQSSDSTATDTLLLRGFGKLLQIGDWNTPFVKV
ncbi:hypothetical protein V5799_029661 [Amblyomma americanum]|uniref:Uncharacterized protein n=1 Tax=Amblyomma americanum TaxID=6943 RepID=A0AAQ4EQW0_AMBAM